MLNCPQRRINHYFVGIREKQSGTVKNVEHPKNDYHERSKYRTGTVGGETEML